MTIALGCLLGFAAWFVVRYLVAGFSARLYAPAHGAMAAFPLAQ